MVLLKFLSKSRKFANKEHKVLRLATDDLTTYSEFKQQYPRMNVELLEESQENLNSSPEPKSE
jgi:molybdopterin converting factor small subunit